MSPRFEQVAEIRRRWQEQGRPHCEHDDFGVEGSIQGKTGDYQCRTCGVQWRIGDDKPPPTGADTGEDW